MRKIIFTFIVYFLFCSGSFAQATQSGPDYAERLKVAEQLMALAGSPAEAIRQMGNIAPTLRDTLTQQIKQSNPQLTDVQLKRVIDLQIDVISKSTSRFATEIYPLMVSGLVKSYAEKFSLAELNSIYQFQSSELGRKNQQFAMSEIPDTMKTMMASVQKIGTDVGEGIAKLRQQLVQEGIVLK
jgi:hypothetical protein